MRRVLVLVPGSYNSEVLPTPRQMARWEIQRRQYHTRNGQRGQERLGVKGLIWPLRLDGQGKVPRGYV